MSQEHDNLSVDILNTIRQSNASFARVFGDAVRLRRQKFGLKQEELSHLLQSCGMPISQSYLSRLESGLREDPSIQIVIGLSIALQISLDEIIRTISKE
ncbi:MAG: helix-turn-helix domain-containing protein [Oscillochloridaceae bacterium umkhey_bin13]